MNAVTKNAALSLLLISILAGCSEGDKAKTDTQVAAKVNGQEITVHQINFALTHLGNPAEAQAKDAPQKVLNSLVDQQLMTQKAIEQKMDRDPQVVQAIEAAKTQILAQSYIQHKLESLPRPASSEIKAYYDKHPELFSDRRIYRIQELRIAPPPEKFKSVQDQLQQGKGLQNFVEWLKTEQIPFSGNVSAKAAEQLPLEILPKIHELKDGEIASFAVGNNMLAMGMMGSQPQPLSLEKSQPFIETFLLNQERMQTVQSELKKLRDGAKIEYVGEFAKTAELTAPKSRTPAAAPPGKEAKEDNGYIQKGLSGLK